jgi:hypothetical protein
MRQRPEEETSANAERVLIRRGDLHSGIRLGHRESDPFVRRMVPFNGVKDKYGKDIHSSLPMPKRHIK